MTRHTKLGDVIATASCMQYPTSVTITTQQPNLFSGNLIGTRDFLPS